MRARSTWPLYRILLWPGVIVHELSHALVAKILGAKIYSIVLWEAKGGHVTHGPTKVPVIGTFLVAIAPVFGGLAAFATIAHQTLTPTSLDALSTLTHNPLAISVWNKLFATLPWSSGKLWVFFFLIINAGMAIAPSYDDIANARSGFITLGIIGIVTGFEPIRSTIGTSPQFTAIAGSIWLSVFVLLVIIGFWTGVNKIKAGLMRK